MQLYYIPQENLDEALFTVRTLSPRYKMIKEGKLTPLRCEKCNYCRHTKVLSEIINYRDEIIDSNIEDMED